MQINELKQLRRSRRKQGLRKRINGTAERPRLTVYRSLKHIYAQIVDDVTGKTLVSAGTIQDNVANAGKLVRCSLPAPRKLASARWRWTATALHTMAVSRPWPMPLVRVAFSSE
jgi:ribosomal protein L18